MLFKKTITYIIICFVCFSTLLHAGENENQAIYDRAQKLIDEYRGDTSLLNRAYKLLEKVAIANPNSEYAYVGIGRLTYKAGYINSNNFQEGSLEQAKEYFKKAININPEFFDAYYYGAYPYLFSKEYDIARQMVREAEKIRPKSPKVDLLFAKISEGEKDYKEVIKRAKLAISKKPEKKILSDAYSVLSCAYIMQKKYDLAENVYQSIIEIEPNSPWARVNYSSFLRKHRKNYDKAIDQGKIALELMDFGMGHKVLGDAYYRKAAHLHWNKKQRDESRKYFLLAIDHNPYNSYAYYGLGCSYYHTGYKNKNESLIMKAKEAFVKAIQLNPDNKQAKEQLNKVRKLIKTIRK